MTARQAFIWLALLVLALVGLTLGISALPLAHAPAHPSPPSGIVIPVSDTPTLTAQVALHGYLGAAY